MNHSAKVLVLSIFALSFTISALAQETISANDAANYIGKKATVCDTVAGSYYSSRGKGQPTFLDLGKSYPHQLLTVLIWGSDRGKFERPPETLSGKEICVTGVIQSYHGRPEIVVREPSQIRVR